VHSLAALGRARALNARLMDEKRTELIDIEAELGGLKLDNPFLDGQPIDPTKSAPLTLDEQQRIHSMYRSLLQVHTNLSHEYEQLRAERAYLGSVDKDDTYKKTRSVLSECNRVTCGGQMWPVLGLPVRSPYEFNAAWDDAVQQALDSTREEMKHMDQEQASSMQMDRKLEDRRWMLRMHLAGLEEEQEKLTTCAWWKWLAANRKSPSSQHTVRNHAQRL
jgi:hypothetical protein